MFGVGLVTLRPFLLLLSLEIQFRTYFDPPEIIKVVSNPLIDGLTYT